LRLEHKELSKERSKLDCDRKSRVGNVPNEIVREKVEKETFLVRLGHKELSGKLGETRTCSNEGNKIQNQVENENMLFRLLYWTKRGVL
jgi:hypothetical protein